MTSWNGKVSHSTGPFGRGLHGRFPSAKASVTEAWCFLWCQPDQTFEQTVDLTVIQDALAPTLASHENVFEIFFANSRLVFGPHHVTSDHTAYGLSQWETTLLCNVVLHWLSPFPERSLISVTLHSLCILRYVKALWKQSSVVTLFKPRQKVIKILQRHYNLGELEWVVYKSSFCRRRPNLYLFLIQEWGRPVDLLRIAIEIDIKYRCLQ